MAIRFLDDVQSTENVNATSRVRFLDGNPPVAEEADPSLVEGPQGLFNKVKEAFTGDLRTTPEIEQMPDIGKLPEFKDVSLDSLKASFVTMTGDNKESVKALLANFPGITAKQDEKGNYSVVSAIDGKEYAVNKPGFDTRDLFKGALIAAMFASPARLAGSLAKFTAAGGIQTGIEAAQSVSGGEFNIEQIPLAASTELLAPGLSKAFKGGKGAVKGLIKSPIKTAAQEAVKEAEETGVKVLTSDIKPPTTFAGKLGQAITERVPVVGTGPVRVAQQETRTEAVRNIIREYGGDQLAQASDEVMEELIKKRGKDIGKYTEMKSEVIERLNDSGKVNVDKTLKTLEEEISKLNSLKTKGVEPIVNIFEDYKQAFFDQDLKNIELLRKQLGEQLKDPSLAHIRSTGEKSLSKIYKAVRDDMGDFISKTGEKRDITKWKVANKQLSNRINELEVSVFKSVLKKGKDTPEMVRKMLFSKKPSDIKLLYKNLPPDGRDKAKIAIMQEVVQKAGGIDKITPEKFLTQMKKMEKSTDIIFDKNDKKVFNGLIKALNLTKRAGEASVKPPTGVEVTTFAAPTFISWMLGGNPVSGLAGVAGIGGLARIYESKPIRNLLLQLDNAKPGNEKLIIDKFVNLLQAKRQLSEKDKK